LKGERLGGKSEKAIFQIGGGFYRGAFSSVDRIAATRCPSEGKVKLAPLAAEKLAGEHCFKGSCGPELSSAFSLARFNNSLALSFTSATCIFRVQYGTYLFNTTSRNWKSAVRYINFKKRDFRKEVFFGRESEDAFLTPSFARHRDVFCSRCSAKSIYIYDSHVDHSWYTVQYYMGAFNGHRANGDAGSTTG